MGLLSALAGFCIVLQSPTLDATTFKQWFTTIVPTKDECSFEDMHWRPSLWGAATEANKEDKPILLWVMNGHPLACT